MNEIILMAEIFAVLISIFVMNKFLGLNGLYAYNIVATIAGNIQVLKCTKFCFYDHNVALGSVIFSSIFIVDNLINEKFGLKAAKQSILISSSSYLILISFMYLSIFYTPTGNFIEAKAIETIFNVSAAIFASSIISYFISQFSDVYMFAFLKKITNGKMFLTRLNLSGAFSGLIDQFCFSALCWKFFYNQNISWYDLFKTYILFGYIFRISVVVTLNTSIYIFQKNK